MNKTNADGRMRIKRMQVKYSRFVGVEEVTREMCKFLGPDELQVFLTPLQAFSRRGRGVSWAMWVSSYLLPIRGHVALNLQ